MKIKNAKEFFLLSCSWFDLLLVPSVAVDDGLRVFVCCRVMEPLRDEAWNTGKREKKAIKSKMFFFYLIWINLIKRSLCDHFINMTCMAMASPSCAVSDRGWRRRKYACEKSSCDQFMRVIKQHTRTQLIEINLNFSKLITIDVTNLMMGAWKQNAASAKKTEKHLPPSLSYILISSNNSQSLKVVNLYQLTRFRIQFMASEWLEY